ncbi:MAG: hypothetical protein Kow0037_20030 [Calditrichia bacterium]
MKKKNTWVFYFFVILFTAGLSTNLVWRFTPMKSDLRQSLIEKLRPALGNDFTFDDFSIGFGILSLDDVVVNQEAKGYQLFFDHLELGISLTKALTNKFNPLQTIEYAILKNPRITILNKPGIPNAPPPMEKDLSGLFLALTKLKEIKRIFVKNGELFVGYQYQNNEKRWLSRINGSILLPSPQLANVHLRGCLFGGRPEGISLSGQIRYDSIGVQLKANFQNTRVNHGIPFLDSPSFSVKDGYLDGQININGNSFDLMQWDFRGNLNVSQMSARLFDQKVVTEDFAIRFDGLQMNVDDVSGKVEDGNFVLSGNFGTIFYPGLYLSIDVDNYSAKYVRISAPILNLLERGKLQGHLEVNGPNDRFVINGTIYSSKVYYAIAPFYRSSLDFTFADNIWTFHRIKTHSIGLDHLGEGEIDFNLNRVWLNLYSHRHIDSTTFNILDQLNQTEMEYYTTMSGDFNTLIFQGAVNGIFRSETDTVFSVNANYRLEDDFIEIESTETSTPNLTLHAEISNLWDEPHFDILELKSVPFDTLSGLAAVDWLNHYLDADFYFSGPVNYPTIKMNLISRQRDDIFISLLGNAANLIEPGFLVKGRFHCFTTPQNITGNFELKNHPNKLIVNLNAPRVAKGHLEINAGADSSLAGNFYLNQIELPDFIRQIEILQSSVKEGQIAGEATIAGTRNHPVINFELDGSNFIINQNGYYSATVSGQYQDSSLTLPQISVTYNNRPIMEGSLNWNPMTDAIQAEFSGQDVESNFLAATFLKKENLVRGKLDYQINARGVLDRPQIIGTFDLWNGIIKGRAFEKAHAVIEDSIPPSHTLSQIEEHIFKFTDFQYVEKNTYTINGSGKLAAKSNGVLDVRLQVRGNVLADLPRLIPYFQEPVCVGELNLHISGSRENPQLRAGTLEIYNGTMNFESVIPPFTQMRARIELKEDDSFVHIKNLEGNLLDRWVKIYNIPAGEVVGEPLAPWNFEDLGLNFGVLVMETDPRGIPLSVPGLMRPGDIGYFAVFGKNAGEKFYFAGPPNLPHVRGAGTLFESRVTFPFLIDEETYSEEEETPVLDFLMNIDWDVKVTAGLGNRYFVDIPAVIGQVYMDLNIDHVSPGLTFTGRLIDESFRVEGQVESTRGRVEYLDMNFRVDRLGAIFNKVELYPEVYGRAYTTVRDSTNFPRDIYLVLYAIDPETKQEVSRGRWEDFRFKLVSSDPTIGETQQNVLAYLGYSVNNLGSKAGDVGLTLTENYLIRPLVRPLERRLEKGLNLDYVRLRSNITSNLFYFGFQNRLKFLGNPNFYNQGVNNNFDPALLLLQSSEITFGKYLLQGFYLTYTGQLVSIYDESKLGLNHRFGLEYRLLRNTLLEFEYDKFQFNPQYYSRDALSDWRIRLRHSINF